MKLQRTVWLVLGIVTALSLLAAGCASAPEPEPDEPAVETATDDGATTTETKTVEEDPKPEAEYNRAKNLRALIEKYDAREHAEKQYDAAEEEFKKGETAYGTYNSTAKTAFEKAIEGYEFVIEKAFTKVSRKNQADEYKKLADDLKASVAMKGEYAAAIAKYNEAVKAEEKKDYESAGLLFAEVEAMFRTVYAETKLKKERAEKALTDLDLELDEFEKIANESEGGDQ